MGSICSCKSLGFKAVDDCTLSLSHLRGSLPEMSLGCKYFISVVVSIRFLFEFSIATPEHWSSMIVFKKKL